MRETKVDSSASTKPAVTTQREKIIDYLNKARRLIGNPQFAEDNRHAVGSYIDSAIELLILSISRGGVETKTDEEIAREAAHQLFADEVDQDSAMPIILSAIREARAADSREAK